MDKYTLGVSAPAVSSAGSLYEEEDAFTEAPLRAIRRKAATILNKNEIDEQHRKRAQEVVETYLRLPEIREDGDALIGSWDTMTELIAEACQCTENIALGLLSITAPGSNQHSFTFERKRITDLDEVCDKKEREQQAPTSHALPEVSGGGERPPWE